MPSRKYTSLPYKEEWVHQSRFSSSRGTIKYIVIHTMIGTTQSAINLFANAPAPGKETSAHYGVSYNGLITAWLEEYYTAYHCGNFALNMESIGIEHEDMGNYTAPRPDALYESSAKLVADICKFYGIPCNRERIRKHNEIVATGCPHNLDIDRIIRRANEILGNVTPPTPTPTDPCEELKKEISFKDKVIGERDVTIVELNKTITTLRGDISFRDKVIGERDKTIVDLNVEIENLKKQIANMPLGTNCDTYINQINAARSIIWDRWTWIGTRGWKNRLNELKKILI